MAPFLPIVLLAQAARAEPLCPAGNALAGLLPETAGEVEEPSRLTDGVAAHDGESWLGGMAIRFKNDEATATFDLGQPTRLRGVWLQADDDDVWTVSLSEDGESFERVWTRAPIGQGGLRGQGSETLDAVGRYLRIQPAEGDGRYSISEVQAFCDPPATWPPPVQARRTIHPTTGGSKGRLLTARKAWIGAVGLVVLLAPVLGRGRNGRTLSLLATLALVGSLFAFMNQPLRNTEKIGAPLLALVTVAWLAGLAWQHRKGRDWGALARKGALLAVIVAGTYGWTAFGSFHGNRAVHHWDTFHYFLGSRYFAENGYTGLYDCATVAQADDGYEDATGDRKIRDLTTNEMTRARDIMAKADRCREAFTPERWEAFRQDVRMYRHTMSEKYWERMFRDHGYNASPVWNMFGSALANLGWRRTIPDAHTADTPANLKLASTSTRKAIREQARRDREHQDWRLRRLAALDYLLYAGVFLLLGWAFGLETAALAALVWGVGHPWPYYWTGGAYGRIPWLFTATAGLCLFKKGYPLLGGFFTGTSALLRLFPAAMTFGGLVKAGQSLWRERRLSRPWSRWIAGGALAVAILVPASLPSAGGIAGYRAFAENTSKHNATPLTNHMGLPTLVASRLDQVVRATRDFRLEDNYELWKEARRETLHARRPAFLGLAALSFLGLGLAARRMRDWEALAASTVLFAVLFQLTCYYYVFVVLMAPLVSQRPRWTAGWVGMAMLTQGLQYVLPWTDEAYLAETLAVLLAYAWIIADRAITGDPSEI